MGKKIKVMIKKTICEKLQEKGKEDNYPTGKEIEAGPKNSPGRTAFRFEPNNILASFKKETE
jgi:hypothetical protein